MACPNTERCPLYPQFMVESSLDFWKQFYCDTNAEFQTCARFKLVASGEMPDPKLLPNGKMLGIASEQTSE